MFVHAIHLYQRPAIKFRELKLYVFFLWRTTKQSDYKSSWEKVSKEKRTDQIQAEHFSTVTLGKKMHDVSNRREQDKMDYE